MTELEPGVTLTVQNVNLADTARDEIRAAREQSVDPTVLIRSHRRIADLMELLISREGAPE